MFLVHLIWHEVTGVMDTCDRHLGAIAMRVSCIVICLSSFLCVCASGSAHSRSPPPLYVILRLVRAHRHCTTVLADYARFHRAEFRRGWSTIPLDPRFPRQAFSILKVVLYLVVGISKKPRVSTKSRCSHWCMTHLYSQCTRVLFKKRKHSLLDPIIKHTT